MVRPSSDFGEKRFFSASFERRHAEHAVRAGAGDGDADLAAAFRHEHTDQCEARGLVAEFLIGRLLRYGKLILVMISDGSSAVENMPVKKSSALMRRLLVMMVAPSPRHAAG